MTCSECERPAWARGLCSTHYRRWWRAKQPKTRPHQLLIDRIMCRIDVATDGCWNWTGTLNPVTGYGAMSHLGQLQYAHRLSYELLVGPIPDGLDIDHLCRNRRCVRPTHLEPVTRGENLRRGVPFQPDRKWTHCLHGHPLIGDNVRVDSKSGDRRCNACSTIRQRAYRAKKRDSV